MKSYDLVIIGSGPGGYVSALYASRHNLSVCVIEKDLVGGTCLNRGCIPTKVMLNSASILSTIKNSEEHGIKVEGYKIDFSKIISRKDEVVQKLRTGIETLFRANKIDLIKARAKIVTPNTVAADRHGEIQAKFIIIASGSKVTDLPNLKIDERDILSSDGILDIKEVPASLAIVGGGVIGCEFATLFNALGTKVAMIELMDRLLAGQSREISKKLESIFKKKGIEILTSSGLAAVNKKGANFDVSVSGGKELNVEKILVSVGRRPNTEGLADFASLGIRTDKGKILVNDRLQTALNNIYAIGDCVEGPLLAHKASYDGMVACDNILGRSRSADYSNIPNCIWTEPEIASVGLSEEEAKAKCPTVKIAKFPYIASGKAAITAKNEGFIKIIGDPDGHILGIEIFGDKACDLIGEATLAKTLGVNIKNWAYVVHGHPTLSEVFQEAAHIFCGTAIHSV